LPLAAEVLQKKRKRKIKISKFSSLNR